MFVGVMACPVMQHLFIILPSQYAISADMIIGFKTRRTTRNEALGTFTIGVQSKIVSELNYTIGFRHIQGNSPTDATVETIDFAVTTFRANPDALFGFRGDPKNELDPLENNRILTRGTREPTSQLLVTIFPDVRPELDECFTITILRTDTGGNRVNFICHEDIDNPTDFFCDHTICILNDDG